MKYFTIFLLFLNFNTHVYAVSAHVHGLASLDIATDKNKILIMLKTPGFSLFGFGTKPTTQKQKEIYEAVKKQWFENNRLFSFSPLACKPMETKYQVDHSGGNHSEVLAEVTYECDKATKGAKLLVNISKVWPAIHEVQLQLLTDDGAAMKKKYHKKEFKVKL